MFPGLDLYCTDPAQHVIMPAEEPDDLSVHDTSVDDLSEVCKGVFTSGYAISYGCMITLVY